MALQGSGAIKFSEIATEFGRSGTTNIGSYLMFSTLPDAGTIKFSDFHGVSRYNPDITITLADKYFITAEGWDT